MFGVPLRKLMLATAAALVSCGGGDGDAPELHVGESADALDAGCQLQSLITSTTNGGNVPHLWTTPTLRLVRVPGQITTSSNLPRGGNLTPAFVALEFGTTTHAGTIAVASRCNYRKATSSSTTAALVSCTAGVADTQFAVTALRLSISTNLVPLTATWTASAVVKEVLDDDVACTIDTCIAATPGGATHTWNQASPSCALAPVPRVETDLGIASNVADDAAALFASQGGLAALDPTRAAIVVGGVYETDATLSAVPSSGAVVSVLNHPEFGTRMTRSDGTYELAVHGGETLTLVFTKPGQLTAHRKVEPRWNDLRRAPEVQLVAHDDGPGTTVTTNAAAFQVARGRQVESQVVAGITEGARRATVLIPPGTISSNLAGSSWNLHVTEFTVGADGARRMPADLPPNSAYTYAFAANIDEATAQGIARVTFNQPLPFYVENFPGFDVGQPAPIGSYDEALGRWNTEQSGRIVKVVSKTGGRANLAVTLAQASGTTGASAAEYTELGITDAERDKVGELYTVGVTLMRVRLSHFSTYDINWNRFPPAGAVAPIAPPPRAQTRVEQACTQQGSIIECENQVLGEEIPVVGTPYSLRYSSDRTAGYRSVLSIPLTSNVAQSPAPKRVDWRVHIAGRLFSGSASAAPNQVHEFAWDGKDAFDRSVRGEVTATVEVGNVYDTVFGATGSFGSNGGGIITGTRWNGGVMLWKGTSVPTVGTFDARGAGLGGWSLNVNHTYEPNSSILREGSGERRQIANGYRVERIASPPSTTLPNGTNISAFHDFDVAVAPDGSTWRVGQRSAIQRRLPDGTLVEMTGQPPLAPPTDGMILAHLDRGFASIRFAPNGDAYVAETAAHRVWRITNEPTPHLHLVAGSGATDCSAPVNCGDGGDAKLASLHFPEEVDVDGEGRVFISDSNHQRVRRVNADGTISTVLHIPEASRIGGVVAMRSGDVYADVQTGSSLQEVYWIAASGSAPTKIVPNVRANVCSGHLENWLFKTQDEELVFSCGRGKFYMAGLSEYRLIAGNPANIAFDISGDGGSALQAKFYSINGLSPGPDGSLYILEYLGGVASVRKLLRSVPTVSGGAGYRIPSTDGDEVYEFDSRGKHLRTASALTGATRLTFAYDANGRLNTVTDANLNVTTIQRDATGQPTAIVGPFGHTTPLSVDATSGMLATLFNPQGGGWAFTSAGNGLLSSARDPSNKFHFFTFDARGRLQYDRDAAGFGKTITATPVGTGRSVVITSPLNRTRVYGVTYNSTGDETRTYRTPGGVVASQVRGLSEIQSLTHTDGSSAIVTQKPDPRWGLFAPLSTLERKSLAAGTGKNAYESTIAATTLNVPTDPFSLTHLTVTRARNVATCGTGASCASVTSASVFDRAAMTHTYTSFAGRTLQEWLDPQERVVQRSISGVAPQTITYDSQGRISQVAQGSRTVALSYGADGLLASVTDPAGRVTTYTRDLGGRITSTTLPGLGVLGTSYDSADNVSSVTPPGASAYAMDYEPRNLLASFAPPLVSGAPDNTSYNYDADAMLTSTQTSLGTVTRSYGTTNALLSGITADFSRTFSRQPNEKVSSITAHGDNVTLGFTYEGFLPVSESWSGTGLAVSQSLTRSFDHHHAVSAVTVAQGASSAALTMNRDNDDLLTSVSGAGAGLGVTIGRHAQNGRIQTVATGSIVETRTYDATYGELASLVYTHAGAPLYSVTYTRDPLLGRVTSKVEMVSGATTTTDYGYDLAGRLTSATVNGATTTWGYDARSNRIVLNGATVGVVDAQDRLSAYDGTTYVYDQAGNRTSRATGAATTAYTWDRVGNLRSAKVAGIGPQYTYDGRERRVHRVDGAAARQWVYDGQLRVVGDYNGSQTTFVYASRTNVPDLMLQGGTTYRLITDQLGSVRLVVNASTGAIAQDVSYDAWGVATFTSGQGFQPFGFAGGIYDASSGLVHFGAREYDPAVGRWLSKDAARFDGGLNFYAYAANDPVNFIDPDGRTPKGAGIGAAIGGAFGGPLGAALGGLAGDLISDELAERERQRELDKLPVGGMCGGWSNNDPTETTCTTKCAKVNVDGTGGGACTGHVSGSGSAKTENDACAAAKSNANSKAGTDGCRADHCRPCECK